jgi:hypothetical protein
LATVRDELRQDSLWKEIRIAELRALSRHRGIKRQHANSAADSDIPHLRYPREGLVDKVSNVECRATALAAEAGSPARAALLTQRNELADRQWLGAMKADVLAEIERLKQIGRLEASQRDTVTNRITTKTTEVAQALVTDFAQGAVRARGR